MNKILNVVEVITGSGNYKDCLGTSVNRRIRKNFKDPFTPSESENFFGVSQLAFYLFSLFFYIFRNCRKRLLKREFIPTKDPGSPDANYNLKLGLQHTF